MRTLRKSCPSYAILLPLAAAVASLFLLLPGAASATDCPTKLQEIQRLQEQLRQLNQEHGNPTQIANGIRDEMIRREQFYRELGELRLHQQDLLGRGLPITLMLAGELRQMEQVIEASHTASRALNRAFIAWDEATSRTRARLEAAKFEYRSNCGEPPDDPECQPAGDQAPLPTATPDPNANRQAASLLRQLLDGMNRPSQLVRIRPDGTVVDALTGEFVENPSVRAWTLRVDFNPGSPFRPGQVLTYRPVPVQITSGATAGNIIHLAAFFGPDGRQLMHAPTPSRPSPQGEHTPSDISPQRMFLVPMPSLPPMPSFGPALAPGFAANSQSTVTPFADFARRYNGQFFDSVSALDRMLESITPWPANASRSQRTSRLDPNCGYHAVFNFGGSYVGVGAKCGSRFGKWIWHLFQGKPGTTKGISVRFSETHTRRGPWRKLSGVSTFVHLFTIGELSRMDDKALALHREILPGTKRDVTNIFKRWEVKVDPAGGRAGMGTVLWRRAGLRGTFRQSFRSPIQFGCNVASPAGYQEIDLPG